MKALSLNALRALQDERHGDARRGALGRQMIGCPAHPRQPLFAFTEPGPALHLICATCKRTLAVISADLPQGSILLP